MEEETREEKAKRLLLDYLNESVLHVVYHPAEIHVVWYCKTLQHWKALLTTSRRDGMYYEITHNGDKNETYIDAYKKMDNVVISD